MSIKWNTKPCAECGDIPASPLWVAADGRSLCEVCFDLARLVEERLPSPDMIA